MKATGIVRRIDDLGRVVIPKKIRSTMRIRDGDRHRYHWKTKYRSVKAFFRFQKEWKLYSDSPSKFV